MEISSVKYLDIANDYNEALTQVQNVDQHYWDAAYEIVMLSVFDPTIDLIQPFYNAYLAAVNSFLTLPAVQSAVVALQRHVLDRAVKADGTKYTDINDWLTDEGIQVPQLFADVSAAAGYTIDEANIA